MVGDFAPRSISEIIEDETPLFDASTRNVIPSLFAPVFDRRRHLRQRLVRDSGHVGLDSVTMSMIVNAKAGRCDCQHQSLAMKPRLPLGGDKRADSDDGRCIPRAPDTGRCWRRVSVLVHAHDGTGARYAGLYFDKAYVADDGERLTLFEWESATTLQAWATHPEHVAVKKLGRQKFYTEYRAQVCELVRELKFRA